MTDAATFFANKKRKNKKAFKFNANLIDASTISSTVHIAAPAISTSQDYSATIATDGINSNDPTSSQAQEARQTTPALIDESKENGNGVGSGIVSAADQWDDEALAATMTTKKTIATPAVAEVRDMRSLDPKRHDQGHIAEKLRVEQTKAQLAAAREGMEREAEKARLEKERKQQDAAAKAAATATATAPRFGVAAAKVAAGGSSGIWLPKHRQLGASGLGGMGARGRLGAQQTPKFDVENEELFPDLAAAGKILEKKEKESQVAFKVVKKTPVGGGATWASKSGVSAIKASKPAKAQKAVAPPAKAASESEQAAPTPVPEAAPAAVAPKEEATAVPAAAVKPVVKKTKKKKKDLSTFKPSS